MNTLFQSDYEVYNNQGKTLQEPKYNVKFLRFLKPKTKLAPRTLGDRIFIERIIKKAIYKFASPSQADKIINGFKRSDGSDTQAEINFLKADVPPFKLKRDKHYLRALEVTERLFKPDHILRPVAFPDLRYYPWNLKTSAEAPFSYKDKYFQHTNTKYKLGITDSSRRTFHNLYNEMFEKNRRLVHDIKHKSTKFWTQDGIPIPYYWHSLHTRAHLTPIDKPDKNRAVFGTPKLLLKVENMFLWPLVKEYLNKPFSSPMLWGYETFKGGWKRLYNHIFSSIRPHTFLGIDWSGFDRLALFEVIDDVHNIWKSYFDFTSGYQPTNEYPEGSNYTDPSKLENLWNWMTHSIKFTPILAESGNLYQFSTNGIASGFQETQLLDSFVNCIMILTTLSSLGVNIESDDFFIRIQGDDSLVAFPELLFTIYGKDFLTRIGNEAKLRFNADLNVDKSSISDNLSDIDVLSYKNKNGTAYRDELELLAQLLYPERHRSLGAIASSCVGIALASVGQSKLVYDVCHDVWKFLTDDLFVSPKPIKFLTLGLDTLVEPDTFIPTRFPTMLECLDQQDPTNKERSEQQKQRLWPNKPWTEDPSESFYFLD